MQYSGYKIQSTEFDIEKAEVATVFRQEIAEVRKFPAIADISKGK